MLAALVMALGIATSLTALQYGLRSTDTARNNVAAFGVFHGTHLGEGGPMPPTGKATSTNYVYVMHFTDGKISHMDKIWHAGLALKELGWG